MKIELQFTKDYANAKKGEVRTFSHQLAYDLIKLGVAEKVEKKTERTANPPQTKVEKPEETKSTEAPKKATKKK